MPLLQVIKPTINPFLKMSKLIRYPWIYDLECYRNLFSAVFRHSKDEVPPREFILFTDTVDTSRSINQMPQLLDFLQNEVYILIGYYNHEYDDILLKHLINKREVFANDKDTIKLNDDIKLINDKLINKDKKPEYKRDKYIKDLKGRKYFHSMDLQALFNRIDRASLKSIAVNLKWPNIIDLPFEPASTIRYEDLDHLMLYNNNDVDITKAVLEYKREDIAFRKQLSLAYDINVINANDTNIAKAIIKKFYCEETGRDFSKISGLRTYVKNIQLKNCVSPKINFCSHRFNKLLFDIKRKTVNADKAVEQAGQDALGNEIVNNKTDVFRTTIATKAIEHTVAMGGLHSNNIAEEFIADEKHTYIDADVRRFYPNIIVNDGLYPKHLGPEFTIIYRDKILRESERIKKLWQDGINVEVNKTIDEGFKKTANGTFGLTKSKFSWLYDPTMTTYICISGQLYILMLIERIEELTDCIVIYSNTDGFTVRIPKGSEEDFYRICQQWMDYTKFTLEYTKYKRMILSDINSYLMITDDGTPKQKGRFLTDKPVTKGYQNPIVAKALNEYYLKGIPPKETIRGEKDLFMFIRAQRVNLNKFKVEFMPKDDDDTFVLTGNDYRKGTELQKTNRFIVTTGNPKEGRLIKTSIPHEHTVTKYNADLNVNVLEHKNSARLDKLGKPAVTQLQKGRLVTLVNDIAGHTIENMKINYDFYEKECIDIIKEIKLYNPKRHLPKLEQLALI